MARKPQAAAVIRTTNSVVSRAGSTFMMGASGPITDLNVMTRRGRLLHSVERLAISRPVDVVIRAGSTLILCHKGEAVFPEAGSIRLGPLDTLLIGPDTPVLKIEPAWDTTLFVVRITAAA